MKNSKKEVKIEELRRVMIKKLLENGYLVSDAVLISEELIENEMLGKANFGIKVFERLLGYDRNKKKTKVSFKTTGLVTVVDAGGRFAHSVSKKALNVLELKTKKYGVHVLAIKNCTTFIKAGYLVKRIVDLGFVGISFLFVSSKFAAVEGIREPIFGSNPISIGIPCGKEPFIYDSSTSMLSGGALSSLKDLGIDSLDQPLGVDGNGDLTSSLDLVKTILPLGGNKGLGLIMAVEILAGSMLGYKIGIDKDVYTADNGILAISVDPSRFGNTSEFFKRNAKFIKALRIISKGKIHIPGEGYASLGKYQDTVSLDESVLNFLRKDA